MGPQDPEIRRKELARRKRERIIMVVILVVMAGLTYLESQVIEFSGELPFGASVLVFALINLNALLIILLLFLVFRNLVKLLMERRRGVLGSRLRTKLVVAFVLLALAPTVIIFASAFQFLGASMEFWFSGQVERSLVEAMEVAEAYNRQTVEEAAHFARRVAADVSASRPGLARPNQPLSSYIESRRNRYDLTGLHLFDDQLQELALATQSGTHPSHLSGLPLDLVNRAMKRGEAITHIQASPTGDYVAAINPLDMGKAKPAGAVVAYKLLPRGSLARVDSIRHGLEDYRQLKALRQPIETNQIITLSLVTLLIVFVATWFGFHLAKTLTVPIRELAEGTQRVAEGDYDFTIDMEGTDEIGTLINSFNRMTADLRTSQARLDEAQTEMRRTNLELDRRRRYMEIVLQHVAAGVVAVDADGIVTTFNPSAQRLLGVQADAVMGRPWREVLPRDHVETVERLMIGMVPGALGGVDKQVRLNVGGEPLSLMVHMASLRDEGGQDVGVVVVFEDMTELEKAQRMAAWREVARRIAHEVKNPLTPIKLSAQRLMRRYGESLGEDDPVFAECTTTIVRQVEELRSLVSEFSTFARLPAARPAPADLVALAEESLSLFRGAHPEIAFELDLESAPPVFEFDREQMSRVLINLLDNAVAAVAEGEGPAQVGIRLSYDDILKIVRIEVEDTGPGVPPDSKLHLFEPYFSTKKGGTGLGLSIVSTVVADHNGYIRVQDNQPTGTRIIIELPARGARPPAQEAEGGPGAATEAS